MKNLTFLSLFLFVASQVVNAQDSLKYSKKQVAEDIRYFFKNAADIHPNLYHNISEKDLTLKSDSLINQIPDSVSLLGAYQFFVKATAFIGEGHTGVDVPVNYVKKIRNGTFLGIPVQATGFLDGLITANLLYGDRRQSGVKIISINNWPAKKIISQLMSLKGGLASFREVTTIKLFRFNLAVIGIRPPYLITYLDSNQHKQTENVNGISESQYNTSIAKSAVSKPYTFTVVNGNYGYINFKSMVNYDGFTKFCDSVFSVMSNQGVDKLIVDLRENSGGNSMLGRYLLNYITTKPYRMAGAGERKVSQQFKDLITRNQQLYGHSYDDYLKLENGSFLKMDLVEPTNPGVADHQFKGRVCFLISPYTFSSANMLASTIKDYHLATLIGQAVGEPANDYGEVCSIKLPQTGLIAFTSTTLWVRPNNDKTDNAPVSPDYLVKKGLTSTDNVLEFSVKWLGM